MPTKSLCEDVRYVSFLEVVFLFCKAVVVLLIAIDDFVTCGPDDSKTKTRNLAQNADNYNNPVETTTGVSSCRDRK